MALPLTAPSISTFSVVLPDEQATPPAHGRHRQCAGAGRHGHAVGRPRRRQDHVRARADPLSRRRRDGRSAEPDLHADAELRPAAVSAGACRPLPAVRIGRTRRARLRRSARRRRGAARMARPRRRHSCRPTGSTSRSRSRPSSSSNSATPASPATARSRRASTASRRCASSSPRAAMAKRCARACRATPRRASYERLALGDQHAILMNSPRRPDGPPVRDGKPYSAIAHLAETVSCPSWRWRTGCGEHGFSAPDILHADLEQGLLIHRGPRRRARGRGRPAGADPGALRGRGRRAARAARPALCPTALPVAPHVEYRIPPYDMDAFLIEAELLLDWYPAAARRGDRGRRERGSFRALWREPLQPAIEAPPTWVLRDFHSPNLLWLPERSEHRAARHPRLPGRRDGAGRLRSRLAAAGRPRRRAGADRGRAARPLRAWTRRDRRRASTRRSSSGST